VRGATAAGFAIIVDGAFLKRWQRQLFRDLALELRLPFVIVSFVAPEALLRERIKQRLRDANEASDADLAVLRHQLRTEEPLMPDERADAIVYDTSAAVAEARRPAPWHKVMERLSLAPCR
jgi:predicted kinase